MIWFWTDDKSGPTTQFWGFCGAIWEADCIFCRTERHEEVVTTRGPGRSQSSIWWDCEVQRSSSSEPPAAREVSTIPDFLSQVSQYVSFLVHSPFELFFSLPATKGARIIHLPGPIQGARASSGQESSPPSWEPLVLILRPWELWRPPGQEAVFMTVKNTPSGLTVPINKKMLVISNVKYTFFLVIRHCFIYKNSFMWIKLSKLRFVESF